MSAEQVSITALQAMMAQETGEVFLICLTITHPDIATMRLVNNTQIVSRTAGDYVPCPMQLKLPDQTDDKIPQVQIVVDNVDREVLRQIRLLVGIPQVTMEVILASSPNHVEAGPFDFSLMDASYDVLSIHGTLGYQDNVLNQMVPAQSYQPTNSPGLFPVTVLPTWAADYVGIPYADKGRTRIGCDCWGIVRLVLGEVFGVRVPDYADRYCDGEDWSAISAAIVIERDRGWQRTEQPRGGDVVILRIAARPWHCGVMLGSMHFLHAAPGDSVVVDRLDSARWSRRLEGIYRHG